MSELEPVGSMSAALYGQVGIDFSVTPDGRVHFTVDLKGKHFIGVDLDERGEEQFAQLLVAASFAARRKRAERRNAVTA